MKLLLDSDFLSQPTKPRVDARVTEWQRTASAEDAFISVVTLQEIQVGIALLPAGRKRNTLQAWFERDVLQGYAERILPVTQEIAVAAGKLFAKAKMEGHTAGVADVQIAATALIHGLKVATLNRKHYLKLGIPLIEF